MNRKNYEGFLFPETKKVIEMTKNMGFKKTAIRNNRFFIKTTKFYHMQLLFGQTHLFCFWLLRVLLSLMRSLFLFVYFFPDFFFGFKVTNYEEEYKGQEDHR